MIEDTRHDPYNRRTRPEQCDECGDWFDGNWMAEVRKNWIVCEDCVRDYQPCGHHKDAIRSAGTYWHGGEEFDMATNWCAECESWLDKDEETDDNVKADAAAN